LTRFLSDGRLPIDNNEAERALRRIAVAEELVARRLPRRRRSAVILTVIASAHRHDLDVWAYLREHSERLAKGETALEQPLPDLWKASHCNSGRSVKRNGTVARTAVIRLRSAALNR
jgi:hypothetical protein